MSDSNYKVMVGPPGPNFSWGSTQALFALTGSKHNVQFITSGNGFDDFDAVWTTAMNASEAGVITHFAMLHLDVVPVVSETEPLWLDTLIAELDAGDLDMVSAICPLKDFSGITSSGIGDPNDAWTPYRRITMAELANLPATFDTKILGYGPEFPLLHNTGCWVADLRKPVFHQEDEDGTCRAFFAFPERVFRDKLTGKWVHARESEDWFFSRCLHRLGAKTAITKKVKLTHLGKAGFRNWDWSGTSEHDDATAHKWCVPRGPWDQIQGWFDFADIYQERINSVNGKPAHFVEVGSWLGKSAVFMAKQIEASGKRIQFDCVDTWQGSDDCDANAVANKKRISEIGRDLFTEFRTNIYNAGVANFVNPVQEDSAKAAERYEDGTLDFVFIDADHNEESVARDLRAWWPKLRTGGILAGHDYIEVGPQAAANAFAKEFGLSIKKRCRSFELEAKT